MFSDKTLFSVEVCLQVRDIGLSEYMSPTKEPELPADPIEGDSQGFLIHSLPLAAEQPVLSKNSSFYIIFDDYIILF